jgi:GNAT superfamily N-acetyltransferase
LFVDKKHRGQGIARAALEGALGQIARLGGLVEAITEVTAGRQAQGRSSSARQPSFSSRTASPASARSANTPGS